MSDIKRFIFERVSENIITKPWMAACYRDYQTREIVMAAWPLNYAITLAWMLNLAWQRYRHRESWIDRMIASEARHKLELCMAANSDVARIAKERDKAREDVMELQDIKRKHEHEELAAAQENDRLKQERDEARQQLRIAVGLLSTQPEFANKHPEDVLDFVKEGAK
jgi:hypothetical protein